MADARTDFTDHANRRPEEIEEEIAAIRGRLGETIAEIERRFRGGSDMAGGFASVAREFARFDTNGEMRTYLNAALEATKRNPFPALLIGAGAAWLAYEVFRHRRDRPIPRAEAVELLADLTGIARQGAKAMRRAAMAVEEGAVREALRIASMDRGHSAALLQDQGQAIGIDAFHGNAPTGDWLPAWRRVEELVDAGKMDAILDAVVVAEDETLARFRAALQTPLPDELQVVIGSRFHEVETTRSRLLSLRDAFG